jgi:DNA-binding transcriptional MerR regulator
VWVLRENQLVPEEETPQQKAMRLLNRQLEELQQTIRTLNSTNNPKFITWQDTTRGLLERFLGEDHHHAYRFVSTSFISSNIRRRQVGSPALPPGLESPEDMFKFQEGCRTAEETLKAAIREVEDFGVYEESPKPTINKKNKGGNGGVTQTFNAPVSIHNLAVATDNAIQKIGHMGDKSGASLKEIAELLQQSEELSPREVREGLAHIQALAVEVEKPEAKRDWKALVERSEAILNLTNKATDLAKKIAPYTPAIITLMEQAKHYLR